jgi:hypothetical protein
MYVKGFAIDYTKVQERFAPALGEDKVEEAFITLIDEARNHLFEVVLVHSDDEKKRMPSVVVFATDYDKDNLEAIPVDRDRVGWLGEFVEGEPGVYKVYS